MGALKERKGEVGVVQSVFYLAADCDDKPSLTQLSGVVKQHTLIIQLVLRHELWKYFSVFGCKKKLLDCFGMLRSRSSI